MRATTAVIIAFAAITGCSERRPAGVEIVESYVDAFNDRDIDAMLALVDEDANWVTIKGTRATPVTRGAAALRAAMADFMTDQPTVRSRLLSVTQHGDFVQTFEQASWEDAGSVRRQCAVAVYELVDERIANVWYFDERACDTDR